MTSIGFTLVYPGLSWSVLHSPDLVWTLDNWEAPPILVTLLISPTCSEWISKFALLQKTIHMNGFGPEKSHNTFYKWQLLHSLMALWWQKNHEVAMKKKIIIHMHIWFMYICLYSFTRIHVVCSSITSNFYKKPPIHFL